MESQEKTGNIYVVATPIGNLEDMTLRAIRILQEVDIIAAEDTRHTGKLLQHFQIKTPQISYHEHNQQKRTPELISMVLEGKQIALVTDAGIPMISDPGFDLVNTAIQTGINIIPIPGANAAITALIGGGLPTDRFIFEGFLPTKGKERKIRLEILKSEERTMILYESPHRLKQTLNDLLTTFGNDHQIVIARELTKIYEQFWRGTILEAIAYYQTHNPQGEFTLLIAGKPLEQKQLSMAEIKTELTTLINQGIAPSQATRQLAELTGLPKREIYQIALTIAENS
jgi:16S rRNA (cytidine1402-2'-O)-methyltransferase